MWLAKKLKEQPAAAALQSGTVAAGGADPCVVAGQEYLDYANMPAPEFIYPEAVLATNMKKAAELLKEGKYTVAEVSYQVGINDPFYFSKCFKQQFGMSPSAFSKQTDCEED